MSELVLLLLRIGFLANFFSRPVMSGFTIGSAIVIAWGQLRTLVGSPIEIGMTPHWPSILLGVGSLVLWVGFLWPRLLGELFAAG